MNGTGDGDPFRQRLEECSRLIARARTRLRQLQERAEELRARHDGPAEPAVRVRSSEEARAVLEAARRDAGVAHAAAVRAVELSADAHERAGQVRHRARWHPVPRGRAPAVTRSREPAAADRRSADEAEEPAHLLDQRPRLLERGEVATPG
jgi:hypothetical protein